MKFGKRPAITTGPRVSTGRIFQTAGWGSFSELAEHEHGRQFVTAAANALIEEFRAFVKE